MSESTRQFIPLTIQFKDSEDQSKTIEKLYKLRCGYQALEFVNSITEGKRDVFGLVFDIANKNDVSAMTLLTWACLITEHPETTKADVYEILDQGGIVEVQTQVLLAFGKSVFNQKMIADINKKVQELAPAKKKKSKKNTQG